MKKFKEEIPLTSEELLHNEEVEMKYESISKVFVEIHKSVLELAQDYYKECKRQVYVTPTRFIEIFDKFKEIMTRKSNSIESERSKYLVGIQKLEEANVTIKDMQEELRTL
jgi:dynein heavy chain